jgi:hypothetical protein
MLTCGLISLSPNTTHSHLKVFATLQPDAAESQNPRPCGMPSCPTGFCDGKMTTQRLNHDNPYVHLF